MVFLAVYTLTMWLTVGGNLAYLIVRIQSSISLFSHFTHAHSATFIHTHMHTNTSHMCTHIYTLTYTPSHTSHTCTHIYTLTYTPSHTHPHIHTLTYTPSHSHAYTHSHACTLIDPWLSFKKKKTILLVLGLRIEPGVVCLLAEGLADPLSFCFLWHVLLVRRSFTVWQLLSMIYTLYTELAKKHSFTAYRYSLNSFAPSLAVHGG